MSFSRMFANLYLWCFNIETIPGCLDFKFKRTIDMDHMVNIFFHCGVFLLPFLNGLNNLVNYLWDKKLFWTFKLTKNTDNQAWLFTYHQAESRISSCKSLKLYLLFELNWIVFTFAYHYFCPFIWFPWTACRIQLGRRDFPVWVPSTAAMHRLPS